MKANYLYLLLLALLLPFTSLQAQEEPLEVVASFSILADVVSNVAGDAANVTTIMPRGTDPHAFQPTPRDLATLAEADVVFINGANFEEGLLEAIENARAEMNIIEAAACVNMLPFGAHEEEIHEEDEEHEHQEAEASAVGAEATAEMCAAYIAEMETLHEHEVEYNEAEDRQHEEAKGEAEDHEHEHGTSEGLGRLYTLDCGEREEHEAEGEAHDHGACDPHVWTEPHNMMYQTMLIRDTLSALDATNADIYTANAAAYLETLDALAHDFYSPAFESIPEENRMLVTNHESFGYLAEAADLDLIGVVIPGGSTLAEPSAAEIATLIDIVNEAGASAIFVETITGSQVAEQISAETGAAIYTLYSDSLSEADGPAGTYIDYLRYNVSTIVEALGGTVPDA